MGSLIQLTGTGSMELQQLQNEAICRDVIALNDTTSEYGLVLNERQVRELIETRSRSLRDTERVELGAGAITRIIGKFCTSSYIDSINYADTIGELLEIFYYFKTESKDKISDTELIDAMYDFFEGPCHGSAELLAGRELESVLRYIKDGRPELSLDPEDYYDSDPEADDE